jgi:hypothetical protein
MAEAPPAAAGRIFISYRREETAYAAGWLFNRLADHFGRGQVFKDVDSIELGDDFVQVITNAVGSTNVLLALIGDQWLAITDDQGKPRLDNPDDFVRLEIEAALSREVRVIPILVEGAAMPRADELPPSLAPLARRQALELSPSRFDFDTSRLLKVLDKTLAEERKPQDETASTTAPPVRAADADTTGVQAPEQREEASRDRTPIVPPRPHAPPGWRRLLSARPRILIGVGVGLAALVALVAAIIASSGSPEDQPGADKGNETTPRSTETTNLIPFEDDFSTRKYEWSGGSYRQGAYHVFTRRGGGGAAVHASPRDASSAANLRITVDAHRSGGTAEQRYGYGIFCMGDGLNSFYVFTIGTNQATLAKRIPDTTTPVFLADPDPDVRSPFQGDSVKKLEAICTRTTVNGKSAVELQFWVDDVKILEGTDPNTCRDPCGPPLESGSFGLSATLGARGESDDTLDVTFDNFEVNQN